MKSKTRKIAIILIIITLLAPSFLATLSLAKEEMDQSYETTEEMDKEEQEEADNLENIEKDTEAEEIEEETEEDKVEKGEQEEDKNEIEVKPEENSTPTLEEEQEEVDTDTMLMKAVPNTSKVLPEGDGVYFISTALDNSKVLDIGGGSTANGANVQLWGNTNVKQQKFEMLYNQQLKTYTIKAIHSNKVLDVAGAGTTNGTNVWQYESNGTEAQQWILEEAGDGYFYIISKGNGLYLDVSYSMAENGTNIQVYEGNGTKAQKFKFTKIPELVSTKLVEGDGIYTISTALDNNKVLDVSAASYNNSGNIQLWESTKGQQQRFELKYNEKTKTYTIMALHSGKVLDVAGAGTTNGTNVQQYEGNGTEAQQWVLQEAGDDYFYIIAKCNELYLDVANGQSKNGANIQTYQGNGSKAQKFKLIKDETDKTEKTIEDGIYQIHSKVKEDKILQLDTSSNQLQIVNKTDIVNNYNTFKIKYLQNGYYSIKVVQSEYNLTVENGKNVNGTKIKSQKQDNSTIQEWIIKRAEKDSFYIIGRCNGLYMDITEGKVEAGTKLQMYTGNQTAAQKFKFEKAKTTLEGKKVLDNGVYYIQSALNNRKVLDISGGSYNSYANVQLWENEGVQQQRFEVTYNEQEKYYQIRSVNSGKVLDVLGNGKTNKTNVHQYDKNNTVAQQWILQEAGNGYFHIFSKGAELYLDVDNASAQNGANIQLYEGNGSNAQKFKFEKTTMIGEETYKIAIRNDSNKFFDISGGSTAEGANLQIWQDSNVNQQVYRVKFDKDKTYCKIIAKHSNKVLTVEANNNVVQRTDTGADNQRWSIEIVGYRYYKIKSKANGLYLDVDCDGTANGTNIKTYTGYDTNAQKFYFSGVRTLDGIDVSEHQYEINWQQVRNAGIDFAIVRVGYGQHAHQKDKYFEQNYDGARAMGLKVGTYLYSYAQSVEDARREAYNCLAWLRGRPLDYPVFYDIEDSSQAWIDPQTMTDMVKAFCEIISNAGYKTGVYTYRDWFRNKIYTGQLPGNYQIWLAHYTWDVNKPSDYEGYYNIWQYTSRGYVPGINGNVDRNIEYRNY